MAKQKQQPVANTANANTEGLTELQLVAVCRYRESRDDWRLSVPSLEANFSFSSAEAAEAFLRAIAESLPAAPRYRSRNLDGTRVFFLA